MARGGIWLAVVAADARVRELEVCARQADALAGQVEAARRVLDQQLDALARGRIEDAVAVGCWIGSTLRVVSGSLGELHTVLDESAHLAGQVVPEPRSAEAHERGDDDGAGWAR